MTPLIDPGAVTHGIQLAIAPVFLLTAVSGMIGAVAGRLSRIIDRARLLEEHIQASADTAFVAHARGELATLRTRGLLTNAAIGLLTLCSFLIGLTIIVLFVGETTVFQIDRFAIVSFLTSIVCFMLALVCFMVETLIATRLLNFGKARD